MTRTTIRCPNSSAMTSKIAFLHWSTPPPPSMDPRTWSATKMHSTHGHATTGAQTSQPQEPSTSIFHRQIPQPPAAVLNNSPPLAVSNVPFPAMFRPPHASAALRPDTSRLPAVDVPVLLASDENIPVRGIPREPSL